MAYSLDFRCKVLSVRTKEKLTIAEVATRFDVGVASVVRWIKDVHIHPLDPTKLKLKPGSLESTFDAQDIGFGLDGLLLLTLGKKGGMFGGGDKKKPEVRDAAAAHLAAGNPLSELKVAAQRLFGPDTIKQIQVVQPVVYAHESMFAGIPVFGNNRIAVRLPKPADSNDLLFASFCLSEFREFAKIGRAVPRPVRSVFAFQIIPPMTLVLNLSLMAPSISLVICSSSVT